MTFDPKKYKKPNENELRKQLTPEQFRVTQQSGTEAPFRNQFDEFDEEGLYVDVVSGEPLFTSKDKFHSDPNSLLHFQQVVLAH